MKTLHLSLLHSLVVSQGWEDFPHSTPFNFPLFCSVHEVSLTCLEWPVLNGVKAAWNQEKPPWCGLKKAVPASDNGIVGKATQDYSSSLDQRWREGAVPAIKRKRLLPMKRRMLLSQALPSWGQRWACRSRLTHQPHLRCSSLLHRVSASHTNTTGGCLSLNMYLSFISLPNSVSHLPPVDPCKLIKHRAAINIFFVLFVITDICMTPACRKTANKNLDITMCTRISRMLVSDVLWIQPWQLPMHSALFKIQKLKTK